ncbi:MAG: porin family protein [Sinobacteraceae bacterium]|nr:porin family protein [Nevskiaceae bacterium]
MKRITMALLAAAALGLGTGFSASAADLPVRAAPPPAPVYNWTGFYFGGHMGFQWDYNTSFTFTDPNGLVPPVGKNNPTSANYAAEVGLQGGYQWQFAPTWLAGIEGDISWGGSTPALVNPPNFVPGSLIMHATTDWISSVRGRLGYIAWGTVMFYGTGGVAWDKVEYTAILNSPLAPTAGAGFTTTKTGYVAGAGVEWLCTPNFMVRTEYLFYGFNNNAVTATGAFQGPGSPLPAVFTWSNYNVQEVRVAMSYKF